VQRAFAWLSICACKVECRQGLGFFGGDRLMAEIFRSQGIKFIIYSDDHIPDHCHAKSADFEVKINISGNEPMLMNVAASGSKEAKFQKTALELAQARLDELKAAMEIIKNARN
jgi:hypothetical protein